MDWFEQFGETQVCEISYRNNKHVFPLYPSGGAFANLAITMLRLKIAESDEDVLEKLANQIIENKNLPKYCFADQTHFEDNVRKEGKVTFNKYP